MDELRYHANQYWRFGATALFSSCLRLQILVLPDCFVMKSFFSICVEMRCCLARSARRTLQFNKYDWQVKYLVIGIVSIRYLTSYSSGFWVLPGNLDLFHKRIFSAHIERLSAMNKSKKLTVHGMNPIGCHFCHTSAPLPPPPGTIAVRVTMHSSRKQKDCQY